MPKAPPDRFLLSFFLQFSQDASIMPLPRQHPPVGACCWHRNPFLQLFLPFSTPVWHSGTPHLPNAAVRLKTSHWSHINPILASLHCLPVKYRIDLKMLLLLLLFLLMLLLKYNTWLLLIAVILAAGLSDNLIKAFYLFPVPILNPEVTVLSRL